VIAGGHEKRENTRLESVLNYIDFMEERGFARRIDCDILREAIEGGLWDAYELYQCSRQVGCDRCGYRSECKLAAEFDRIEELCQGR
jgi:hypothetical protein